jgi:hypothetical protein
MTAPVCPVSIGTAKLLHGPQRRQSIPTAVDLPSLIYTVNVIRDILRSLTTSLTINNVYNPPPPFFKAQGDKIYSDYPAWQQVMMDTVKGYVFHKDKQQPDGLDRTQRAYIIRTNSVEYQNKAQPEDKSFFWTYAKPLDYRLPSR